MIKLTLSQVEYLKAIYFVSLENDITVTNISKNLHYSKPSVVRALKGLNKLKLIEYKDSIKLTDIGVIYVNNILRKDSILQTFFINVLKINKKLAIKDAENIINSVSCYTITQLEQYLKKTLNIKTTNIDNYCLCNNCNKKQE
jgi:Mn-dependent DtxR family transcriptional regulator